jgi:putative membrane protein (TIGR04086 family)
MLAVLHLRAVLLGLAAGTLVSAVLFIIGLLIARLTQAEAAPGLSLAVSLIAGLFSAGYAAGRIAPVSGRFHGSITALGIAAIVIVVARLSGSPAPTGQVLFLALIAIVLGGLGGWLGGRRRYNGADEPTG